MPGYDKAKALKKGKAVAKSAVKKAVAAKVKPGYKPKKGK